MTEPEVIQLDIQGQVCPACLLVALKELNAHRAGLNAGTEVLLVRTDHRDATRTIPDSARAMGYEVDVAKASTCYEIRVRGKR
jgi:hypothetical protein